ncbi:DUF835 domain-containing protein [Thermococcus henrietii]|uniref:DUF835 domain-containing protein n=1 Tax=Thermococcus henrietii TaxID=2016361 RepID=UPI000C068A26|nr:DUF835 domain-containing protein [Thermococcus henrietii]
MNYLDLFLGIALLVSYVLLFYNYHLTGRKALLYYSLAWLSLAVPMFSLDKAVYAVGLASFSTFLWAGNVMAIEELSMEDETRRDLLYLSILPILFVILLYPGHETSTFLLLGLWICASSVVLGSFGGRDFLPMAFLQGILGVVVAASAFVPFLRFHLIPAVIAVFMAFESVRTFLRTSFIGDFSIGSIKDVGLDERPGLLLVPSVPENVLSSALVFSRVPRDCPNWFWITTVHDERAISPTNLPKILDMAVKFMREAGEAGKKPIIVIDGLDYLVLENGFSSVLKFLSALRDYALVHGATVFIVGSDDFLSERERKLLRSIVGEGNA